MQTNPGRILLVIDGLIIYAYSYIKYLETMTPSLLFKCLSDNTRLRCVTLLQQEGRLCVCELTAALDLSQPKISRHLAFLRQSGLLLDSREGQWVYYQISQDLPAWVFPILEYTLAAVQLELQFQQDKKRLEQMENRPERLLCC